MVELQSYLTNLLQNTLSTDNNLIREFLEVDENVLAMAIKQSKQEPHKETSYAERLNNVVKDARKTMIGMEPVHKNINMHNSMARTKQYSVMHGKNLNGSSTPPSSPGPLQSGNRTNSFTGSRTVSSEQNGRQNIPPNSPLGTPQGSFSHQYAGRENRMSSNNQNGSRFLLNTYSGQSALDVALALEDLHRREAFNLNTSQQWGKQQKRIKNCPKRENLPVPWSYENEMSISNSLTRYRVGNDSESDIEGAMFRDDNNSFILDIMSEPVMTILNTNGLALHEELDIQAEIFLDYAPKRRLKVAASMIDVIEKADWMGG
jgi:hypothetical protein